MASERALGATTALLFTAGSQLLLAQPAAAAAVWWTPLALQGTAVTQLRAGGTTLIVRTGDGRTLRSTDAGATFTEVPGDSAVSPPQVVTSGDDSWSIDSAGRVLHATRGGALQPDPGSPALGAGARLLAAPAALPGSIVVAGVDGTVYRRCAAAAGCSGGRWARCLLLLPESLVQGVPAVTALAAFTEPVTDTVYLGTNGYSVLLSTDGGDDWIRAGPGLPDTVNALAADAQTRTLYAATPDGVFAHRLQALPTPAVYRDSALALRWIGIALVVLVASVAATALLLRIVTR
jgi:hypothetical protein